MTRVNDVFIVYNSDYPGSAPLGFGADSGSAMNQAYILAAMLEKLELHGRGLDDVEFAMNPLNLRVEKRDTSEEHYDAVLSEYQRMWCSVAILSKTCTEKLH